MLPIQIQRRSDKSHRSTIFTLNAEARARVSHYNISLAYVNKL